MLETMLQTLEKINAELEKQNRFVECLLSGLAGPPPVDYFKIYLGKAEDSLKEFSMWRNLIAAHSEPLGRQLALVLAEHRKSGFLTPPEVTAEELTASFKKAKAKFENKSFERFMGPAFGDLRLYMPSGSGEYIETKTPPTYSIWGPMVREGTLVHQKITASNVDYVDPENLPPLHYWQTDLIYNAYRPDLGMISWSGFFRNHNDQLRSIGYELNGRLMWINELIDRDGHGRWVKENGGREFVVSVDYRTEEKGMTIFNVFAVHTVFNLKNGTVRAMLPDEGPQSPMREPRILQMRNAMVSLGKLGPRPSRHGKGGTGMASQRKTTSKKSRRGT